jgi:hypothetical protein
MDHGARGDSIMAHRAQQYSNMDQRLDYYLTIVYHADQDSVVYTSINKCGNMLFWDEKSTYAYFKLF